MSTLYPASLDNSSTLPYPTSASFTNSPSLAGLSDNQNDAIIAAQTKLGTGASTPTNNNLLIGTGTGTSAWSKVAPAGTIVGTTDSQTLTNKILTAPTINSPVITNATITTDLVTGYTTSNTGTVYGVPVTTGVIQTANTIDGVSLRAGTVPAAAIAAASLTSTQIATNGVSAANLATSAIFLGYASSTSDFTTASVTEVQVTSLTATVTVPAGGRKVKITTGAWRMYNATANTNVEVSIWRGVVGSGTKLGASYITSTAVNATGAAILITIDSPSAGSVTYNIGFKNIGGANATYSAAAGSPSYILVEAI